MRVVSHGSSLFQMERGTLWCDQATCRHTLVETRKTELASTSIFAPRLFLYWPRKAENLEKFLVMTAFCLGMEKLACLWFIFKWITHHNWIKSTVISKDFSSQFFFFFFLSESREQGSGLLK